jgi:transcriptional regulator with XRE-family HTH domain
MTWMERLTKLLDGMNLSRIASRCGWKPYRISQMLGRENVPNVEDAVRLCRELGVAVEDIWGDDAEERFAKLDVVKLRIGRKAPTMEAAAERAAGETARRIGGGRDASRQAGPKARGKAHGSG